MTIETLDAEALKRNAEINREVLRAFLEPHKVLCQAMKLISTPQIFVPKEAYEDKK